MPIVRKVIAKTLGSRPVLVEFDNAKIKPEAAINFEANLYETQACEKVVGVTSNNMLYTGIVEEDQLYNNFILIHKKESDEVKLIQVDHAVVRPRLTDLVVTELTPKPYNPISELNKQFGSKKARKMTEQKERLTMNIDAVKTQLETTVAGIKLGNTTEVTENDSIYRPKINRDASTPDGVYNLEDLVEAYILDTLAVEAGIILENGTSDELGFNEFCASNINKILATDASEEEQIRRITIFLYIHYLIKFMITPMKNITKKFVVCDKSVDVNNHILNVFSETGPSGRTRPLHMKDKALCYTMILAAIAMNFEVDVEMLSKDLKIGVKKAVEVARILAFNAKGNNKHVVQLKLPLPAPVTYTPKRRGR